MKLPQEFYFRVQGSHYFILIFTKFAFLLASTIFLTIQLVSFNSIQGIHSGSSPSLILVHGGPRGDYVPVGVDRSLGSFPYVFLILIYCLQLRHANDAYLLRVVCEVNHVIEGREYELKTASAFFNLHLLRGECTTAIIILIRFGAHFIFIGNFILLARP